MGGRVTEENQTDPEVLNMKHIPADLTEQLKNREANKSITHQITVREAEETGETARHRDKSEIGIEADREADTREIVQQRVRWRGRKTERHREIEKRALRGRERY
jgi:hypothetical protein